MGLLDGIIGGAIGAEALSLIKGYVEANGGVAGVAAKLEKTGLGQQVASWIGTGSNLPVSAEQIHAALGSDMVKEMAAKFGIPIETVSALLAEHLPTAIDKATPDGKLPS